MEYRIGHIGYSTKDMDRTLGFYRDVLNFRHIFSLADDQGRRWIEYLMTPDGRFIELFVPENAADAAGTYKHLCLEVDDLEAAVRELAEKGVSSTPIRQGSDGNFQAWIKDPDGRDIELMQLAESSDQYQYRNGLK